MSCSVNLLPERRLQQVARARRRNAWLAMTVVGGLLIFSGWAVQGGARAALRRLGDGVQTLQARRARLAEQQETLAQRRAALYQRLRIVADARRSQPWPEYLTKLASAAPEGVFLTSLTINPWPADSARAGPPQRAGAVRAAAGGSAVPAAGQATGAKPRLPPNGPPKRNTSATAEGTAAGLQRPDSPPPGTEGPSRQTEAASTRTVQLQGYAISHTALLEFLNVLQGLRGWQAPALLRATLESFPSGEAVQFEIASRVAEEP